MNKIMEIYNKCEKLPFGNIIFSKLICFKAPYFSSIKPQFIKLKQGYCEVLLPKRRAVTNHINSIHAIAMCNVSDLAAGTMLEASIPNTMRWIPKKMTVSFLKIAKTDLRAVCEMPLENLDKPGELHMPVHVKDKYGEEVFRALITMHLSLKK